MIRGISTLRYSSATGGVTRRVVPSLSVHSAGVRGFAGRATELATTEARPDYYAILGVPRDADATAIKVAFREKAKQYHPDAMRSSPAAAVETFQLVNEAYRVLSDDDTRRRYDADVGWARPKADSLRARNEGWHPESSEPSERVRESMARAAERVKEGFKARAHLARSNRMRIAVPSKSESYVRLAYPLAIAALWVFNLTFFST